MSSRAPAQDPAGEHVDDERDVDYKTELIKMQAPWHTSDEVEIATLTWVDWYNEQRLHGSADNLPPTEYETIHQRSHQPAQAA
ncbi:integrase core domain-containing protein [Streptomyces sp. NPDC003002]